MSEAPVELLADLASKEAQIRLITDGLPDEYALPDGLLDEGIQFCEWVLASDLPTTARQREAVGALLSTISESKHYFDGYNRSNIAVLVESDPVWRVIRDKAREVILAFTHLPYG